MNFIQIITDEWIDVIYINEIEKIAKRKSTNDYGLYEKKENRLFISWEKWGIEEFIQINQLYYHCKQPFFEIRIENNEWNDIAICTISNQTLVRKYYPQEKGYYRFERNDLIVNWDHWGIERFYSLQYGKQYTNTRMGYQLKNQLKKEIKILAIVFPQFHEIPENNLFWGNGFTEWTLLQKIPRIVNGEIIKQPHPDIGYFNLNTYEHRKYMRILANKYSIYGFCYYHYWFSNKKVMYEPLEHMLLDGEPNKSFLFCWANEPWTRRWDGGNNEILLEQIYTNNIDNEHHFYYLLPFFKQKQYIKKENKPIFIFYRIDLKDVKHIQDIIYLWNRLAIQEGFRGIHFMKFLGPFDNRVQLDEINGYVEFEPGYCTQQHYDELTVADHSSIFEDGIFNEEIYIEKNRDVEFGHLHYNQLSVKEKKIRTSPFFIYDGSLLCQRIIELKRIHPEQHRGMVVSWNNTPRRNYTDKKYGTYPHYYRDMNPSLFGETLQKMFHKIKNDPNSGDDFLFLSAWNEWNEQAILEPNNEEGYQYLYELNKQYHIFYNCTPVKKILNICHLGGGTEKYMNDLKQLFPEFQFIDFDQYDSNINYDLYYKDIDAIHINSMLFNNLKDHFVSFFSTYVQQKPKLITIHDYQWIFPDHPNITKEEYVSYTPREADLKATQFLFSICTHLLFPSINIYQNYQRYIDISKYHSKIIITSHNDKIIHYSFFVVPSIHHTIHIAFVGYYTVYKGSKLFEQISQTCQTYQTYSIQYHVFGETDVKSTLFNHITYHGKYTDDQLIDLLHYHHIHGILHLSLFEESYCYALTHSINSGIPILCLDRGCFRERLTDHPKYKYTMLDKWEKDYILFLEYLLEHQNTYEYYKTSNHIQPTKWYITEYELLLSSHYKN